MAVLHRIGDIDWAGWQPVDRATILFIVRDGEVLLIRKKRGLGAGKMNGPGGRIEVGETALACALRETREETGLEVGFARPFGELSFQFADGYSIWAAVFSADTCRGTPIETDEAIPRWTPLDAIPYAEMWADDVQWLPLLLAGRFFRGRFLFDGDHLVDFALDELAHAPV